MKQSNLLPKHIVYILINYLFGIIFFTFFRLILLTQNVYQLDKIDNLSNLLIKSFIFGLRFDIVTLGFLLALPTLFLTIFSFLKKSNFNYYKITNFYLLFLFFIAFLISLIDIPYYNQFLERLTIEAFQWMDTPLIVLKMVFTDKTNFLFIFILLLLILLLFFYYKKILKKFEIRESADIGVFYLIIVNLILISMVFLGIRGRIQGLSPIRVGTAYFSNYSFINKLGLNPSFTLIKSILVQKKEKAFHFIDDDFALNYIKKDFNSNNNDLPLAREEKYEGAENKYNIVLIMIESMTAKNLEKYGGDKNLTPFLNSIMDKSIVFNNFYAAGTHTHNGIYACLTSFPTILTKHRMKGVVIPKYNGIPNVLKNKGYSTSFFINHDSQFDNVGGFVKNNDFDFIFSQKDYPDDKIISTFGVGDDFMFEFSIDKINQQKKPFFTCFMTTSNHVPYIIPKYAKFTPKSKDVKKQLIEYTDWSLAKFINLAKKEAWFDNTIFIFTGDHGKPDKTPYEISFAFHRVPLIIYAPKIIKPKELNNLGGQIDIFPVVMHLLNSSYINNTYGENILSKKRKYIYFTNSQNIACVNEEFLYVSGGETQEGLYRYRNLSTKNYLVEKPELAADMKNYVFSMLQSSEWIIKNKKTYLENLNL